MAGNPPDSSAASARHQDRGEASLLSIDIAPSRPAPAVPPDAGDGLIEAWARAHESVVTAVDAAAMEAELGEMWRHCFWVEYFPERHQFLVSPNGPMPDTISARLSGANDSALLVRWINHIATRHCHSRDPVVSTGRLDFEAGATDLELTLVPMDVTGDIVTRFLGTLGL